MSKLILETYYIFLPIVATALIGWVGYLLKDQKKKEDDRDVKQKAQTTAIMLVLRYMLQRYHGEYKLQGKITYSQYKNWQEIYETYRILGGNSIAEEWNEEVEEMEKAEAHDDMSLYELALRNKYNKADC